MVQTFKKNGHVSVSVLGQPQKILKTVGGFKGIQNRFRNYRRFRNYDSETTIQKLIPPIQKLSAFRNYSDSETTIPFQRYLIFIYGGFQK